MTEISIESLGLILVTTIFLSMLLVPFAAYLARIVGAIDIPKSRSSHAHPTPRMGGLAMSLSLTIACLMYLPRNNFLQAFLSGLLVVVLTGVIDDIVQISPRWKFVGQIIAAILFVHISGMRLDHIGNIVGTGDISLEDSSFAFTVFCLVGGINTFNLADGLDGLAAGVSLIATVFFGYFAWHAQSSELVIVAIALSGAVIGFLRYNSYPAKIFMGDSGSLMLGYVVAVLLVSLSHTAPNLPVPALVMVVALPLLDTLLVMVRRMWYGHSPFLPDRTHLHHRLLSLGLPHPAVVAVIYCLMFIFGSLAVILKNQPDWMVFPLMWVLGLLIFIGVSGCQHTNWHYIAKGRRRIRSVRQLQVFRWMELVLRNSAHAAGMLVLIALFIPALFAPLVTLNGNKVLTLFLISGLMAAFSWRISAPNKSILHGTIYLAIFALMVIYEVSSLRIPSWLHLYIPWAAGVTLSWVILKLIFSEHNEIVFASSFELLMLFVCWFIPFVVLKEMNFSKELIAAIQNACLLAIPYMLAMKINIRNLGGHNRWIMAPLFFGLIAVGMRSVVTF
jgi:UDP-GlcNAc:undecaprenyl-phosphate GlcNAc-1-phosphate transferase